jgi:ABC-type phosphate transport system permease subunit
MAILSLVMAVAGFASCGLTAIPAVVFGHIGLHQMNRAQPPEQGKGLAVAGLVLGYLMIVGFIAFIALVAFSDGSSSDY